MAEEMKRRGRDEEDEDEENEAGCSERGNHDNTLHYIQPLTFMLTLLYMMVSAPY